MHANKFGKLIFDDGTVLDGMGFGYPTTVFGEIVFNTGMVGYPETLTDPSYNGQILTLTYPLVGNYGVPDPSLKDQDGISKFFESDKIQVRGLVVHELSLSASHWNLFMTLDEWLYNEKIPGISGIDTRALT
ncbi:MAG: carbamoyl-phosphate synthase domain-containing protein, partial [Nitrosarchaeum sp.]